jgi:bifunctional DNA-binding transcriptional regulator/antitoxin component of YhaV-PrlF toxin-antitoxin module
MLSPRKLIAQGAGAITLTIPKKWVEKKGLAPGDFVLIEEVNDTLIVHGKEKEEEKTARLELSGACSLEYVRSVLASQYATGFQVIELSLPSLPSDKELHRLTHYFLGMELVKKNQGSLVFHIHLQEGNGEARQIILKMLQVIRTCMEELKGKQDKETYSSLLKEQLMLLRNWSLRVLRNRGNSKAFELYDLAVSVEKLGAELFELIEHLRETGRKTVWFMEELQRCIEKCYVSLASKNFNKASEAWQSVCLSGSLTDMQYKRLPEEERAFIPHYYYLQQLLRQISSRLLAVCS